ncbi:MAG: hypothetical protein ACREL6_03745, partial [Gemmatimonadales bacterium]
GFLFGLAVLAAAPVSAQTELGVDLGFFYDTGDPSVMVISIPTAELRAGFYTSDRIEIEPRISLQYVKFENSDAATSFDGVLGLLYHLSTDRSAARWYLRPFAGINRISSGGNGETQFQLGGGVGVKIPAGERLAWRVEGNFNHAFESDNLGSSDVVGLLFGISYYTR